MFKNLKKNYQYIKNFEFILLRIINKYKYLLTFKHFKIISTVIEALKTNLTQSKS